VSLPQYRERLQQAGAELFRGRVPSAGQTTFLDNARALLRATNAVTLASGVTVRVDDSAIAAAIGSRQAEIEAAMSRINARLALISSTTPPIDAAAADARLREIVQQSSASSGPTDLFDAIGRAILRFLSGLRGPGIDLFSLLPAVGLLGIAVILFVLETLGRALPERVRREVLVRNSAAEGRSDPRVHRRAADAALAAGRSREALHALYLYVIAALEVRETIRYDPALTDSELLLRAAAIPHADSLRDLIGLYERSWFGLREPSGDEARRARDLALRVAP
jgi:hypothetical protein